MNNRSVRVYRFVIDGRLRWRMTYHASCGCVCRNRKDALLEGERVMRVVRTAARLAKCLQEVAG